MKPDYSFEVRKEHLALAAVFLSMLVLAFNLSDRPDLPISAESVWHEVQRESSRVGLDPGFIYAVCMAESSLNANANSGFARGLMQMSEGAWSTVSDLPWSHAFRWQTNLRAGTDYMAHLRERLEQADKFSYQNLAAAYRYGIGSLINADYDLSRLPPPKNDIYREIFSGNTRPVAPPGELAQLD